MKTLPVLLTGSLLANAALLAAVAWWRPAGVTGNGVAIPAGSAHQAAKHEAVAAARARASTASGITPTTGNDSAAAAQQAAREFLAGDLKTMVARLRAAGFPIEAIRTMVYAEIEHRVHDRQRAAREPIAAIAYWDPRFDRVRSLEPEAAGAFELNAARRRLGAEALGEDREDFSRDGLERLQRQYGDLPRETFDRLERLAADYDDRKRQIYQEAGFVVTKTEQARFDALKEEQRADLEQLLTPEQLAEYDIRNDELSTRLRSQLADVGLDEAQFREIYRRQRALDESFASDDTPPSFEERTRRAKARQELETQIRAQLSPEQAMRYQIATDPAYSELGLVAARFDIPPQTTFAVVALQKTTQARAATLAQNPVVSDDVRATQFEGLQREVETQLTTLLGPHAYQAYRQSGASWVEALRPTPRETTTP